MVLREFSSQVPLPWKKSHLVISRARIRATAQSFCSTLKSSPVQHLPGLAAVHCEGGSAGPRLKATWWVSAGHGARESKRKPRAGERGTRSARERDLCLGMLPFQEFVCFLWVLSSSQSFVPRVRLTGNHLLYVTSSPQLHCTCTHLSPPLFYPFPQRSEGTVRTGGFLGSVML